MFKTQARLIKTDFTLDKAKDVLLKTLEKDSSSELVANNVKIMSAKEHLATVSNVFLKIDFDGKIYAYFNHTERKVTGVTDDGKTIVTTTTTKEPISFSVCGLKSDNYHYSDVKDTIINIKNLNDLPFELVDIDAPDELMKERVIGDHVEELFMKDTNYTNVTGKSINKSIVKQCDIDIYQLPIYEIVYEVNGVKYQANFTANASDGVTLIGKNLMPNLNTLKPYKFDIRKLMPVKLALGLTAIIIGVILIGLTALGSLQHFAYYIAGGAAVILGLVFAIKCTKKVHVTDMNQLREKFNFALEPYMKDKNKIEKSSKKSFKDIIKKKTSKKDGLDE